jgi:hypothetical protein
VPNNLSDETYKRILSAISISEAPLAMKRILCLEENCIAADARRRRTHQSINLR